MFDATHDPHLLVNLLIHDAVFHESAFLKLLGRIYSAIVLRSYRIDSCKGSLTNDTRFVIFGSPTPFFRTSIDQSLVGPMTIASWIVLHSEYIRLPKLVSIYYEVVTN